MSIIQISRAASVDEIVAEMDRRGKVIERLEARLAHIDGIYPGAIDNLLHHQRQLDMDGIEVAVSRQALCEVLAGIGAALTAAPSPSSEAVGWRPIESAPRDGAWILAVRDGYIPETCCWQEDRWIVDKGQGEDVSYNPNWWQPLPSAPVSHGGAA